MEITSSEIETFVEKAQKVTLETIPSITILEKAQLTKSARRILEYMNRISEEDRGETEFFLESLANHILFEFTFKRAAVPSNEHSLASLF